MHTPARIAVALLAVASPAAAGPPTAAHVELFEKKVRPLFVAHCQGCHAGDAKKQKGGLDLSSRATTVAGGDSGPAVVPGDAAKSLLVQAVRYDGDLKMPPKGKLRPDEIAAIEQWVADGAAWPDATPAAAAKGPKPLFTADEKAFWAFQPVNDPPVPPGPHANPIDRFVAAKLAAAGLELAPPADKRALLRRATYDLTGLPPTPVEIDAFVADASPAAFEKVIDRLLASPAYGERWGRHWLDVARYGDTNGLDENTALGNAWKYRDYVIRSVNADKPYDAFLREQIAGDLLSANDAADRREKLIATGYLVIGPKLLAEPDKQKMLLDIADEQLDTLGKGVMGLTLGCARCHDHKFDPLPARDYYSLLAVFTGTRTMQNLNTVAKAFERNTAGEDTKEVAAARAKLVDLKRDLKRFETQFGKATDAKKKDEFHAKAEKAKADIAAIEPKLPPADMVLCVEEGTAGAYGTAPRNLFVQARGNYLSPTDEAPPVFPRVLAGESQTAFVSTLPNLGRKDAAAKTRFGAVRLGSGRRELADWLTDPAHPLTARVMVNRAWQHHFGDGIVGTPDNFGRLGDRPSHPELLDWLAARFVADGWSLKKLHRRIMLSAVYRQAGRPNADAAAKDPDNRLLWRYPRRRLEAEAIRDGMLAAAGTLDRGTAAATELGNHEYARTAKYDSRRRSVYLTVVRGNLFDFFQTFDFPDPHVANGKRVSTVVAPQALYLLNNPFVVAQAKAFAGSLAGATDEAKVADAYRRAFGREPNPTDVRRAAAFVEKYAAAVSEKNDEKKRAAAWAAWCHTLFAANEFIYLD